MGDAFNNALKAKGLGVWYNTDLIQLNLLLLKRTPSLFYQISVKLLIRSD